MPDRAKLALADFLAAEHDAARQAFLADDIAMAWHHLERAHIIAQMRLVPHLVSHWAMLRLALHQRDAREVMGQLLRLFLAPIGNLTGHLPLGNTGRSTVSAFAPMDIPRDLQHAMSESAR